jgi:TonB family protein
MRAPLSLPSYRDRFCFSTTATTWAAARLRRYSTIVLFKYQPQVELFRRSAPVCCCCVGQEKDRIPSVKCSLILFLLFCTPWIATAQNSVTGRGISGVAEYAPQPKYPDVARWRRWAGKGIFRCKLRADGAVSSVEVRKSTGYDVLDQAAITALRQWRFKVSGTRVVNVPVHFHMNGVRHRMSGAVLFD